MLRCEPFIKHKEYVELCMSFKLYTPMATQVSFVLYLTKTLKYNNLTDTLILANKKKKENRKYTPYIHFSTLK